VFATAIALVRLAPRCWSAVLGGVTLAAVAVCSYALLTKVFPGSLARADVYARIEQPYGYWNATGLTAAMGAIGCMWLGARRRGHALLSAMAYPAMGVLLLTLLLTYSRGALAALVIGLLAWFCIVPLRLRGAALLIVSALAAGAVAVWTFSLHALSSDNVALADRTAAGHRFGALLLAMVLALAAAGIGIGFTAGRRAPSPRTRRRAGMALVALIVLALIAFAGALAHSQRGFTGTISHDVSSLTNPNAKTPPNTPGRLTAVASVRARYWKEALEVFAAHPALGAGAMGYQTARLRYRTAPLVVAHAHGFLAQTLADLGLVGLLLALALLGCWAAAAGRATHPFNRSWTPWRAWLDVRSGARPGPGWRARREGYSAERIGLLTMLCLVITFGVHSLIDWTWYVPAMACAALLCAGWLAGRGPLSAPARRRGRPRSFAEIGSTRLLVAGAAITAALLAAWAQWQPLRAERARQLALEQLASHPAAALASARTAVERDPLSPLALFTLADVERATGEPALARATLQRAVREQPSNPQTWLALGRYDLRSDPADAVRELQAAIYLDPQSISAELLAPPHADREAIEIYNNYIEALRAVRAAAARQSRSAHARR
jgi:O-Antigen ligase/Tetratricopeptide repeat